MNNEDFNTVLNGEFGDEFAQSFLASMLQSDAALTKFSLSVEDYGTFGRLLNLYSKNSGQSPAAATEDIRLKIYQVINENVPNEGLRLLPAIDKFLDHGGQLRLSAAPDAPVLFLLLAGYLLKPESAIKQLKVMIEQLN